MMSGPRTDGPINLAYPAQTQADREDDALARWASLRVHQLRLAQIGRHGIADELNKMNTERQARARYWLNHYRTADHQAKENTA